MSVTIHGVIKRVTDRAVLINVDGTDHWMPKSQIESIEGESSDDYAGLISASCDIIISDWIAEQKGITMGEERYTAEPPANGATLHEIKDGTSVVGYAVTLRLANMIAAALNMTIGKV